MMIETTKIGDRESKWWNITASFLLLAALMIALYVFCGIRSVPNVRDEELMKVPIDAILERGWSVETAIDYQEVKGPAFFWMYAFPAEALGGGINSLRAISLGYFLLGGWALLCIAARCGFSREGLVAVAALYALAPYNAFTAVLLMSEPSFVCIGLWMMYAFICGDESAPGSMRRRSALIVFTLLLTILLHHRPHAVALGGAVAMTSIIRHRLRAWPWIVACAIAAALRLPLYSRWGGMVTSNYQGLFGFGVRLDGLVYMLGAVLPWTFGWLFVPAMLDRARMRRACRWMVGAFVGGAGLAVMALPDLDAKVQYRLPGTNELRTQIEYAGVLATATKAIVSAGAFRDIAMIILGGLGAASLAGLSFAHTSLREATSDRSKLVLHLTFWMLACGVPLYVITAGPVYDRYLVVWMILMPIAWLATLPRWLLAAQAVTYTGMTGYLFYDWIITAP